MRSTKIALECMPKVDAKGPYYITKVHVSSCAKNPLLYSVTVTNHLVFPSASVSFPNTGPELGKNLIVIFNNLYFEKATMSEKINGKVTGRKTTEPIIAKLRETHKSQ